MAEEKRSKRILYIHQYFNTPAEGGCIRSYILAKGLVKNGYQVEMITRHNKKKYEVKIIEGIHVHYLPIEYSNHLSFSNRIFAFIRFIKEGKKVIKKVKEVDLCYTMSTPLSTGLLALYAKKKLKIPYLFEVGDLWPLVPIKMEVIKNPILKYILFNFEKRVYKNANALVGLSPTISAHMKNIAMDKPTYTIPNISSILNHQPEYEAHNPFRVVYSGTIGKANHLEYLLDACYLCQSRSLNIQFDIMGDGSELERIKTLAMDKELKNLSFHPFGNKKKANELLDSSDAVYVSFLNVEELNTGSPNKLFDGLAAGKLIILNFNGWLKELVENEKCGFSYNPEKPNECIDKLLPYLSSPYLLEVNKKNARRLAEDFYSEEIAVQAIINVIEKSID